VATVIYDELEQGSSEWLQARAGLVTASTIGQLITKANKPTIEYDCPDCGAVDGQVCQSKPNKDGETRDLKTTHSQRVEAARANPVTELVVANGDAAESLRKKLIAERLTGFVEPSLMSRAMERGVLDEPYARAEYAKQTGVKVEEVGFIVSDDLGFKLGYSPDGLVGDDGLLEIKSRTQQRQLEVFLTDTVPAENYAQLQTGLLVTGRAWIDYCSYCGGMPLYVKRVYPDPEWFSVIGRALGAFEFDAQEITSRYLAATEGKPNTERIDHYELELEVKF